MSDNSTRPQERSWSVFDELSFSEEEKELVTNFFAILFFVLSFVVGISLLWYFIHDLKSQKESIFNTQAHIEETYGAGDGDKEVLVEKILSEDPYPGKWVYPLKRIYVNQERGPHGKNGPSVDLVTWTGTRVYSVARGKVIRVVSEGWGGGYGSHIIIQHPDGRQTLYGHLSEVHVSLGERVFQGEFIGLSGNTGNSDGPHLHFEVRGGDNPLYALFQEEEEN